MGFFSSKVTAVASSVYNLAGDVNERPQFLRSLVLGATFQNNGRTSISETIRRGFAGGPAMKVRNFFRWAEDNYQAIGVPQGTLGSLVRVNVDVVTAQLPALAGHKPVVQYVRAESFNYSYWAEQYMFENYPALANTAWTSDMDSGGTIKITFADGTSVGFTPAVDQEAVYIYAIYNYIDQATKAWGNAKMFIYKIGSGNAALDNIVTRTRDLGEYVPFIPVRLDNKWVKDVNPAAALLAKKAYKKALNADIEELIDQLAENEDLDEIDYAYVAFGVPLNVKERASREYLFRFFDKCRLKQTRSNTDFAAWTGAESRFDDSVHEWEGWMGSLMNGTTSTASVARGKQPVAFGNEVKIKSNGDLNVNIDITISWQSISETHGTGKKTPDAKKGDVWITYGATGINLKEMPLLFGRLDLGKIAGKMKVPIYIHWQVTDNSWRTLTITGLEHDNRIYKKKSVNISALEALTDDEESGFLVPLHYATMKEMSLVDQTQMMTAGAYLLLNSYKVVKKKWYQTWWFSVILFVAIIVITVVTAGTGTAPALAAFTSIAAAAGLTGIVALIVGAILNTLAMMIIGKILMAASIEVFGAKWGALIGSILTIAVTFGANAAISGQSIASALNALGSATSLIQLSSSVGNGIAGFIQGDTMETMNKIQNVADQSKLDLKKVQDAYNQNIGYSGVTLDPMGLTGDRFDPYAFVQKYQNFVPETRDDFLARTLLTGSDIADMTMDIIGNFVTYSTRIDLPG